MNKLVQKQIDAYFLLRAEIDALSTKLASEHQNHLNCRKGCDQCCLNLRIFPVEYYAILSELTPAGIPSISIITGEDDPCTFLKEHACTIYPSRPIICRTHGLPLLYLQTMKGRILNLPCVNSISRMPKMWNSPSITPILKIHS